MRKIYLMTFMLFWAPIVSAQDVEIPLFDDTMPNLGRNAKPLDSIIVTPAPLPEIRVSLDNTTPPQPAVAAPENKPSAPTTGRITPISINRDISQVKSGDLAKQLQAEIEKTRLEAAQKKAEDPQKSTADVKPAITPAASAPKSAPAPDLEDLFAKTHDVHQFDISGFMLGMTPDEVIENAEEVGYRVTQVKKGIPLFRTSFYEQNCRDANVHRPELIRQCIVNQARSDEVHYISSITLARKATKEYMQILFTSLATDNVAYKIFYENKGDASLNFTRRNLAKKLRRKEAFWNLMFETYGLPDDSEKLIWGDLQSAYMQAAMQGANYNAYIVMEDKDLFDTDYFDAEDQSKELNYRHSFTFAPPED